MGYQKIYGVRVSDDLAMPLPLLVVLQAPISRSIHSLQGLLQPNATALAEQRNLPMAVVKMLQAVHEAACC